MAGNIRNHEIIKIIPNLINFPDEIDVNYISSKFGSISVVGFVKFVPNFTINESIAFVVVTIQIMKIT